MAEPRYVNLTAPAGGYESQLADIKRRQKMAELLAQQGGEDIKVESVGGIPTPISPFQGLAKALQSGMGAYLSSSAAEDEAALKKEQGESRAKALELYFQNPDTTMTMPGGSYQTDQKGKALPKYLLDDAEAMAAGPATKTVSLPDITSNVAGGPTSYADRVRMAYQFAAGDDEKLAAMAPMLLAATQPEAERERVRAQEAAIPKPAGVSDAAWSAAGGIPGSRTELFNKSLETAITPEKRSAEYTRLVDTGYTPGTPEFKAQMDKFNRKDTYIAPVTGPAPGTPQSYLVDGKPFFGTPQDALALSRQGKTVTTPKTDKPETQFQASSGGFADRMITANKYLTDPAVIVAATSQAQMRRGNVPVIGNYLTSDAKKSLDQAKLSFVNAKLRQESGATIGDSEFVKADKQYFPQPGDGPEQIKQKEIERNIVINGMVRSAGPDYERLDPEKQELEYRRSLKARGG
jgi:hypothetical protein